MKRAKTGVLLYPLLSACVILAAWIAASAAIGKEYILPGPGETFRALPEILKHDFARIVLTTLLRSLSAFLTSFLLAALTCILAALIPGFNRFLEPVVTFLRATPTISVIMFALIWMDSNTAPVAISSLVLFPMLYASFYSAYAATDERLTELSKLYKVPPAKQALRLYLPSMLPGVVSASKSNIGLSVKLTVAAEVLSQTGRDIGIGISMQMTKYTLDTPGLLVWTLVAILLSAALEFAVWLIGKLTIKGGTR